ncbi:MAG: ATP-binding protein [Clostridia bacterium]
MNPINFSMNYYALKTFGRQQYSNSWAAISELVANGFDAGAKNVYLYINLINKSSATIEIIDDGIGMNESDLTNKYTIIGRNRRLEKPNDNAAGRKGIGKLAALYLSDKYQIISQKDNKLTSWEVNVFGKEDNDIPQLEYINFKNQDIICSDIWNNISSKSGTAIRLIAVNLERIGKRSLESLNQKLSNYFSFDTMNCQLNVCVVEKSSDLLVFKKIKKEIAFDNMVHIYTSDENIIDTRKNYFSIDINDKLGNKKTFEYPKIIDVMSSNSLGKRICISGSREFYGITKQYKLEGWIGVHSSIDTKSAQENDARFIRNQHYNPNQLRIYVRNKLANENILGKLNLTGTYSNYIEGELSFDILDDNDFEDIATANRQDFSIVDDRVELLYELARTLCLQLISRRQELADKLKTEKDNTDNSIISQQKSIFAIETHSDLTSAGVPKDKADELSRIISNKLKGEYEIKDSFKIFISHASKDRIFTDFISNYLKFRGFKWNKDYNESDIFYSSEGTNIEDSTPLSDIIKKMILDSNTDILFLTSDSFMKSQYCLFEGGAAWATRAILEYGIIALDYNSIPEFLTNGKPEFAFNFKDMSSFTLNKQSYSNLVLILNRLISHLNNNKKIRQEDQVKLIETPNFPDLVQLQREGKPYKDYMDKDVYDYWETYVIKQLDAYYKQF